MEKFNEDVRRLQSESESEGSTLKEHSPVAVIAMESKIKNLLELPYEILLEILGYLSTYDLLRIVPPVSKKFQQISRDPFLIKSIKLKPQLEDLTDEEEEKYFYDFSGVVRRSEKLKFFSLNFIGWDERKFLNILQSVDHHHSLEEFHLKFDYMNGRDFDRNSWNDNVVKYLVRCSNLRILKIQFEQPSTNFSTVLPIPMVLLNSIKNHKFENLKILDLKILDLKILDLKFNKHYIQEYQLDTDMLEYILSLGILDDPEFFEWIAGVWFGVSSSYLTTVFQDCFPNLEILRLSFWIEPWEANKDRFFDVLSQAAMKLKTKFKIEFVDFYQH